MDEKDRLKARQAFIDRHKHELAGLILDGSMGRTGSDYALWARSIMSRIDAKLAAVYDDLKPEVKK